MEPGSKRWVEITESEYAHERGGLAAIRAKLDDADPYRAWSNFTFTTRSGRQYEVDLLVLGRSAIHLLELKHWSGTITGDHQTWFHNGVAEDNPRILADSKAKHFKQLLVDAGGRDVPFVHAGVVLHQPDTQVRLTDRGRAGVYRIDGQGPAGLDALIRDAVAATPRNPGRLIDRRRSVELARLIEKAGVRRSVRHRKVGNMRLEENPLAEGPGWQDYLAKHPVLDRVRRVRFYLVNQAASQEERTAILRAAKREFVTLENVNHPGIARAIEFYEHARGPAVVFEHDPSETRLDHFLREKGAGLTVDQRVDLVRTLANTLRYAHSRRLVHRRLSPLSVFVRTLAQGRYGVRIRDWHTAGRLVPGTPGHSTFVAGTRTLEALTDKGAHGYIAPETLHNPSADPILADVFGLGAVSFLVFTGAAPAETSEELHQRLARERGLDVRVELDVAPQAMADLVRDATAGDVDLRTESVERFVHGLERLDRELTADEEAAERVDPLDATAGSRVGPPEDPARFEVVERLGQGSTALALLVKDEAHGHAVLKVALDEDGARRRLLDEAEVLTLARDPRVVRRLEEPLTVNGRTALLLEDAGRESLAALIRREGRLSLDFLGRWGGDLLDILAALDLTGVNHRDIKPDNLAFRELGKSRQVHLTLFDFSLSRAPLEQTGVGTPPYLDPFFDPVHRPRYDAAAERYAAAVTLHEMATGQTPAYGTGASHPALVDSDVTIDPEAFEPGPARDGLVAFLRKALTRDAKHRHDSIESMRIEWRAVFDAVPPAAATPGSVNPATGKELDDAADRAALETPIASAGLTPRAVDALHRIDVRTVRDLLARSAFEISRLSGVADPTKREIRRRAKQWRARLQPSAPATLPGGLDGTDEQLAGEQGRGVDALLRSLIPKGVKSDSAEARVLRLYLGLDDTASAWPGNAELGRAAEVTAGRVGQILPKARKGWRQRKSLAKVRDEIVALVAEAGGALSAEAVAEALLTSRGSEAAGDRRMRRALGLVRAAVEVEAERGGEARLLHRRSRHAAIVALEAPTDPDAVAGTDLLDYTVRLGRIADRLAAEDPLPTAAATETRLREVRLPQGMADLPAERLAALAAAASDHAAANGRGEIYPDGLDPRRALEQLASSLGVIRHGMDPEQLKARVRARYPRVAPLPDDRHDLDALLQLAKVPLVFADGVYWPRTAQSSVLVSSSHWSRPRHGGAPADRDVADFERLMTASLDERGFVTLSVGFGAYAPAMSALRDRFGVETLDVTADLLTAMRATADANNVDWSIVLRADRPDAARQDAANLRLLVELAAADLERRLLDDPRPLLIVEAAPLARYDRLAVLERLADKATGRPAARWLLLPVEQDGRPYIDNRPAPGALGAVRLPSAWLAHRRRQAAS